jgi:alpha-tubulin suppressor-like RCC1 family protein
MPRTRRTQLHAAARWLTALSLLAGVLAVAGPVQAAAKPTATSLHLHAAAASFRVNTTVVLTGTVRPTSLKQVTIERLAGKKWLVVGHAKPSPAGAFTVSVKAPKAKATWQLRAVRAKSSVAEAGVSGLLKVHVVTKAYTITASAPAQVVVGSPIVVIGAVSPKAAGTVALQTLSGVAWATVATAKLSGASAYRVSTVARVGVVRLRVVSPSAVTTAAGTGKTLTVTVTVPPVVIPTLTITTTALKDATVGLHYLQQLASTGGVAPYTWGATGLPPGLSISTTGTITGLATAVASGSVALTVTDSRGVAANASLPLHVNISPNAGNLLWSWGAPGSLGNGTTNTQATTPTTVGLTGAVAVAADEADGYGLRFDGSVYAWGYSGGGALGDGVNGSTTATVPVPVTALSGITAIASDGTNAYALASDGTVWAWGSNTNGALGDGTTTTDHYGPVKVAGLTGVTAIAARFDGGYALTSDGTVWAWGFGADGQLGNGGTGSSDVPTQVSGLTSVVSIAARSTFALAVLSDGTVRAWGSNDSGQLGDNTTAQADTPVVVAGLSTVTAVSASRLEGYALEANGTVWGWGANDAGQVGDGTTAIRLTPVVVGVASAVVVSSYGQGGYAVVRDGTMRSWGYNGNGQLGNGTTINGSLPAQVSSLTHVVAVGGSEFNGFAITSG